MSELSSLIELLCEPKSTSDLSQTLRTELAKPGLHRFLEILKDGLITIRGESLGLESWSQSQIQAVTSISSSIAFNIRSLSAEQTGPTLVAIVQKSVEVGICFLEKTLLKSDDLSLQNNIVQLLEMALVDVIDRNSEPTHLCSMDTLLELLLPLDVSRDITELENKLKYNIHASQILPFAVPSLHQNYNKLVSLSQHWAIVHARCTQRLFLLCKVLVELPDMIDDKATNMNFRKKLSFSLRILKLLGNLTKNMPYIEYDTSLLHSVGLCANILPGLFRTGFEFVNNFTAVESWGETLILSLLEEFLHVVHVIFYNSNVFQNIQARVVASALDNFDYSMWRYNKSVFNLKPPLAYLSRSVLFVLKLVEDVRRQTYQILDWKALNIKQIGTFDAVEAGISSFNDDCEKLSLLKKNTVDELLKMMFPSSSQWLDNLLQLVSFLHSEGVQLKPKLERSYSSSTKATCASELENAASHEDEALFGDLFSEGSRSVGSNDAYDPLLAGSSSVSICYNMPIQAATEILSFLKVCVFSPEWHPSLYDDACKKLSSDHIDILICILNCRACFSEDRIADSGVTLHEQKKIEHIHDLCFELLHNLIMCRALSESLEEHLIEKILNVENGVIVYNDQTLTLLAHTLLCRGSLGGSQLRSNIYRGFVDYIIEKTRYICLKCFSFKEVLESLPSLFHIEILLMAFHLSPESEKVTLASLTFSAIKAIDAPAPGFNSTQLSFWALLVSRLIIMFRHMIFYQCGHPSSFLLDLKSRLREAPLFTSPRSINVSDHLFSWASIAAESIMGTWVKEEPTISSILNQLVDIASIPASLCTYDLSIARLQLIWDDVYISFSQILGLWNSNKAVSVEDLIIERYIFVICWDIPTMGSTMNRLQFLSNDSMILDISNVEYFFHLSHSLLGHSGEIDKSINLYNVVVSALQLVDGVHVPANIEEVGWDFLRSGLWLSLLLSLFHAGISGYCIKNKSLSSCVGKMNQITMDNDYIILADGLLSIIFDDGQVRILFKVMSSLLNKYLKAYQKAFRSTFENNQNYLNGFSPLLLLKHTGFEKIIQNELLENSGSDSSQLEYLYDLLAKLDVNIDRRASGIVAEVFWECMLHGFPSQLRISSGTLLSCILSIRGIINIIHGILKIWGSRGNIYLDTGVNGQLVDSVMAIKSDKIFLSLHGKCGTIYSSLSAGLDGPDYSCLFPMKHYEGFLSDINASNGVNNGIHELVVIKTIDTMNILRKDPLSKVFKFYLSGEAGSERLKELYKLQCGDLLVLIDSLDNLFTESVNIKVLNFFIDLLSDEVCIDIKQKLQNKFLGMDVLCLSKWLEKRLLCCTMESSGGFISPKGSFISLQECTINFILCLISPLGSESRKLHNHLFEAMLVTLDAAFMQFDIHLAKSYFRYVVQLAKEEDLIKSFLYRIVMLIEKLAYDERLLPGLKFLFTFLGTVLNDCNSGKITPYKLSEKTQCTNSIGVSMASRSLNSRKNSETLVLSTNHEGGSASIECDTISVDEDEDDGTSDGEVVNIYKDDEDDINGERALASKVCTFTSSGSNFMEQHWYFCYTCDLTVSKGCCSVCAKVCHRGHRVVYSRSSRFFCDCGAGGVRGRSCQCLKAREFTGNNGASIRSSGNFPSFLPFTEDANHLPESDSDMDEDVYIDVENSLRLSIPKELHDVVRTLLEKVDVEARVLKLCSLMLPSIMSRREANITLDSKIVLGENKVLSYGTDLLQIRKAYKSGSLDLKIKADYSNSKELKSHLASGSLFKSLLSVSIRGRLAVGEGDKVAIFDIGQLIGQATIAPVTTDKTIVKPLSKNVVRFEIVHLVFNPLVENYLAVAGYGDCQVLTVNPRGEVTDRLPVELSLQGAYIRCVDWVPGSQVQLMVVTNRFVKIYDLSQDSISPMHYFTLPDDLIVDATTISCQGRIFLLVFSEGGNLFKLELTTESNIGAKQLKNIIPIKERHKPSIASSLFFSSTYKLLFLSYQDGTVFVGRFNSSATSLAEISSIYEDEQDGKLLPAGLHHWKELLVGSGLFTCFSSVKSNAALTLSIGPHEVYAQNMRHAVASTSALVGITAYKPLSKEKIHLLVLHDDGSLQIYLHIPIGVDASASVASEKIKKLGPDILNINAYAGTNPEFPVDFFEKTVCITSDIKLGGGAIGNGDSEGVKQSLSSEDGFLESPSPGECKIIVSNSNPDIVMVGLRVHIGNTSPNHIPSNITIFQRVIKLDETMRSWYDIPFTVAESLLADEEFIISIGPTFNGSALSRIDSLEVYGRAKDDFGWKEKVDVVFDMEARVLGCNSWTPGSRKKCNSMISSTINEQVLADGLKLLSRLYLLCRSQGCSNLEEVNAELSKLKCKQLLEIIFESDREPLLQASASHVLLAVFSKKDTYYQVKDTMRLLGVVKSTEVLSSKLGISGATGSSVIEEFTTQMRAVSKIALHRRSNLATFLEINGSDVVDGLMQVLWGILDIEQPDTQTMNDIVISSVELIYCYAECLALHGKDSRAHSVAPAVVLFQKLLFSSNESIQTSSSLAISSRLLQVPFPKQTLLVTDDIVENTMSTTGHFDTTVGNNHVMIEEDSITSSVQYCCDGCSTVPILRRRWHCTVCSDFDLCEACYEVLDADRLPPPHSRDHRMSVIPIEVESISGDGHEIHFSTDEISETNMSRTEGTEDTPVRSSIPSIHVLEPNESGEFSAALVDPVSISTSKRAVNSLLLVELLKHMKGWMESTSGVRAILVMQLFYRLSSAVGGPFVSSSNPESIDLENLIKWFLDEINLNRHFIAKTRSSFGEVAILVFMFFTLMLRNWNQPGSDGSTSKSSGSVDIHSSIAVQTSLDDQDKKDFVSQLLRACDSLRQQAFVNYLMDILQQLVHVFKSPVANVEIAHDSNLGSGCGSLLIFRRDLPVGNLSPFFSDSYTKGHRADIFIDYHRLLLENVFRLLYSLIRPEKHDKTAEKDKVTKFSSSKDLKLDGYQDVLCSYINNPHTTFVRRYARRLFLHLCGSKAHYYSVRDSWQFSSEIKKLNKHLSKSGGIQNPVQYERGVKIVKCLSTMAEISTARPRNWQKYCLRHVDVLSFLLNGVFYLGEESVIQILKLLNLAFYTGKDFGYSSFHKAEMGDPTTGLDKPPTQSLDSKKKKGEDGTESGSDKLSFDMESVVGIFTDKGGDIMKQFVDCLLLEWNLSFVRAEAKCILFGVWYHGKQSVKETLLMILLQKVKCLPMYGHNIVEYTELLTCLLGKICEISPKQYGSELLDRCLGSDVIKCIFDTLCMQNELLANHPNSRIYNTLSGLVEFDGYYLESEPCVACSSPEVPYSKMKLESLKSETKFTDNRIIVKCSGSYTIQTVIMNVHDPRKSKSVKVLNLYYNNRPVSDLSELKNNWSMWKRAKSCQLSFSQAELKIDFPIPITACNFMIELDSFYENLQALSLEPLQCPRCSRSVTDKHGICSHCHENAYQCRQCRNINYENLDSFLCNECGYSKYGRFEFNFMAKPSFTFDNMENDEDMKRGLAAIESESANAHRRYQQLLGFKKPLLKIVSSIGENEMDSQQKDSVQQMMVSLPGPSCKINRKIALLGVLYGEKCKAAFDSVSKSVQTLQGLRRVLMDYLHKKHSDTTVTSLTSVVLRSPNSCFGCATTFVTQCLEILQVLSKHSNSKKQLVSAGFLSELFENNIHQGPKNARIQARAVLCAFSEGDMNAVSELNSLIQKKVLYCLEHHRSMDISLATREELLLLSEVCSLSDEYWESRLRVAFQLLFSSIKSGAKHPAISEHIILPCLRIISQACTPPKPDVPENEQPGKSSLMSQQKEKNSCVSGSLSGFISGGKVADSMEKNWNVSYKTPGIELLSYSEWEKGATYLDFVRRQYRVSQAVKGAGQKCHPQRYDYLILKCALRWKRHASMAAKSDFSVFELGSWVTELVLSACSQSIRSEMCMLISLLCAQSSSRHFRLLNLLMNLLPDTLPSGECASEYFDLLFKMIESENSRLYLTVQRCLTKICRLITVEVGNVESLERSLHVDISQGFVLHKIIELLRKFLEIRNIRARFMRDGLLSEVLEAYIALRGLIVQKTKLITDCNQLLNELLDELLLDSSGNKCQFIRSCINALQMHAEKRNGRNSLFILEQLCNLICPSKPESVYLLVLNKAHTQEEFIRGSMTKSPYSSVEIGPLMRDVKNKICHQLDLLGLLEDDYGMELLVAGNIISLDLSIAQVYELVWKKSNMQSTNSMDNSSSLSSNAMSSAKDYPPMTVTYRLQGLDGEATEPMIKELDEDREEFQDPEVEFAIAGAVREHGGLQIILGIIQRVLEDMKSNQEHLVAALNLLIHCCKIRENRRALLRLGALGLLLETARRAFSIDAMEPAEGILLIVESLTLEANETDNISITQSALTVTNEESGAGEQAKKIVNMFLERLCHPSGTKKSNKQQRNTEMVARILPYLTYGEPAAMEALIEHFDPYLKNWDVFDRLLSLHLENPKDETIAQQAAEQRFALENFVRVSESLKTSSCGERLKDIILEKDITAVAVRHLREIFAVAGQARFKSSAEWAFALKLQSVPLILSMLRGLSMGHLATQLCIDEGGILPLLHALEGVSGENEIGARAENLLDTLSDKEGKQDGFLAEKIQILRNATRDEMRRRALKKREQLLQGLGMHQEVASDGAERIVVSQPILEGLDDVEEEEDGFACMVCREGYTLRPSDMLGVYTYSKRVNLGVGTLGNSQGDCVYTTVSHFNIIHFQCHQEAKRADAALKAPKREWEGATLRNNETLCNSLFPVRGPSVQLPHYTRYVDQYWDNLNALGHADGTRLRLLTYDIVLMLARFATGASFSTDSKGGGRESNSKLLPFMIQMARHLFEQSSPVHTATMSKSVVSYLSTSATSAPSTGTEETVQFMMVNSLLSEPYDSWLDHRRSFLQRGIYHAYMQHKSRGAQTSGNGDVDDLLVTVQPMLVYTGLVEQMQKFFKGSEKSQGWEEAMKEKVLNVKEMVNFSRDLMSWLEEMMLSESLQEAFDLMGMLGDVLSGGFTRCDDFVNAAICAGKS